MSPSQSSAKREPDSYRDARSLLTVHGLEPDKVLRVEPDYVLFVVANTAMTAWLNVTPSNTTTGFAVVVDIDQGFPLERVDPFRAQRANPTFPMHRNVQF